MWPPTHPQPPRAHLDLLYKFWGYILLYLHPRTEAWLWVLSHKVPVEQWRSENNLPFIKKNRKEKRGDLVLNEVLCVKAKIMSTTSTAPLSYYLFHVRLFVKVWGKWDFLAAILDIQLKLLAKILCTNEHPIYNLLSPSFYQSNKGTIRHYRSF